MGMKRKALFGGSLTVIIGLVVLVLIALGATGCGVRTGEIVKAEKRLNLLKGKGIPDSVLSPVEVHLYQLRLYQRISAQNKDLRGTRRGLEKSLAEAEAFYRDKVAALQPSFDSLRGVIREAREGFSGIVRKKFDSLSSVADSFARIGWLYQAHGHARSLALAIPAFIARTACAAALLDSVTGIWECANKTVNPGGQEHQRGEKPAVCARKGRPGAVR